ncbi:hypothetical protein [Nitrobacter winogradskyi]|uniref:Uncharacterized protein n=2 Tax=Nitrobacter winogradskyi TaxID=913 RepID=A0A4Y3WEA0_NITWI|nr:hypothetical protein [Nitrobacter winogradskyi]MCP1997639.1 apolipoprotein N-acyltransferase [Nitrobacter winogradskyi]GEC17347.1 hypothetical protein NWI01_32390 [Nitrobacter winogradskyi]
MTSDHRASASLLVWICSGFLAWGAAFAALYSAQALGCGFDWDEITIFGSIDAHRLLLIGLFLLALFASAVLARLCARLPHRIRADDTARFLGNVAKLSAWAALAATLVSLGPVLFTTACY